MTSKSLFFSLMREDIKHRLWVLILSSIVYFFALPVIVTMMLQNYMGSWMYANAEKITRQQWLYAKGTVMGNYLSGASRGPFIVIAIIGALIAGVSGYCFLHSKKQVDFYHSLPVRREKLFFIQLLDGFLMYLVPYLIGLFISLIICGIFGVFHAHMLLICLRGVWLNVMIFLLFYLVTILATLLTGKLVINFLGISVLFGYAPAVYGLLLAYRECFFMTEYHPSAFLHAFIATKYASPVSWLAAQLERFRTEDYSLWKESLIFVVIAVLLIATGVFLYQKRKSEKAESAMAFALSEPIIRILITIPIGLLLGLVMMLLQYGAGTATMLFWLCFGIAVGVLLSHGIIESLYQADVKRCLSHKLQLIGTMAVTMLLALGFFFDWFGYDSYLPKKSEIRSMAINTYEMTRNQHYYHKEGHREGYLVSGITNTMENMVLTDFDAAYEIARICSAKTKENRVSKISRQQAVFGGGYTTQIYVRYDLDNGKSIYRVYEYEIGQIMDLWAEVYRNQEYKEGNYQIYQLSELSGRLQQIRFYKSLQEQSLKLSQTEKQELLQLYCEELSKQELSELIYEDPVGILHFEILWAEGDRRGTYSAYVYPSMYEILGYMKEHGMDVSEMTIADKVQMIQIPYCTEMPEANTEMPEANTAMQDGLLLIEDAKEIKECMDYLVESELAYAQPFTGSYAGNCIVVLYNGETEYQDSCTFYFKEYPAFVEERLQELGAVVK